MNVAHNNFNGMDSKPLTGCTKHGIFVLVQKDIIFIVSFQHAILYGTFAMKYYLEYQSNSTAAI
jgi:hypothetical protein